MKRPLSALRTAFGEAALEAPAVISLTLADKKYPLHEADQTFDLVVNLANAGPGIALDTVVTLETDTAIKVDNDAVRLGTLTPRKIQLAFPLRMTEPPLTGEVLAQLTASWRDASGTKHSIQEPVVLPGQESTVDWEASRKIDPYALEPVQSDDELIGRDRNVRHT